MFDALCKSGRRTKYSVLSNKKKTQVSKSTRCLCVVISPQVGDQVSVTLTTSCLCLCGFLSTSSHSPMTYMLTQLVIINGRGCAADKL